MTDNQTVKAVNTDNPKPWQFKKGQSGNPKGKPKGTRNKATIAAKDLFEQNSEAITQKIIDLALIGDMTALKLCLDRICPPIKAQAQNIKIESLENHNLTDTATRILNEVTQGNIAPDIGSQLIGSLAVIARTEEIEHMKERVEALEIALKDRKA